LLQSPDAKIWSNFSPKTSPTLVLPSTLSPDNAQTAPAVHPTTADLKTSPEIEILSPRFADSAVFLQGFPLLSFDDLSQEEDAAPYTSLTPSQISDILRKFTKRFASMKAKWNSAFSDVEANYLVVVKDLTELQHFTNTVASSVGPPDPAQPTASRLLWDQVQFVHSTAVDHFNALSQSIAESSANVTTVTQDFSLLHSSVTAVENTVSSATAALQQRLLQVESTLQSFDTMFARHLPILKHLQTTTTGPNTATATQATDPNLLNHIQDLQLQVRKLQDTLWSQSLQPTPTPATPSITDAALLDLQAQVKLLQVRIVGDGVQIGTRIFQSFDDVQAWVVSELPIRRYGLFVDAVSLLDFFTSIGRVEAEKTFSSFYNQSKSGFVSMYEARVATSIQNLFPMVFSKSDASGLDASDCLPAVTNPEKWDNGATGLRYQISRSMGDVEYQLESTIDSVFPTLDK